MIESSLINDILKPNFPHERWEDERFQIQGGMSVEETYQPDPWTADPNELLRTSSFGITMDYFSDLGHQTANSELDATWLTHRGQQSLSAQIEQHVPRGPFDCRAPWVDGTAVPVNSSPHNLLADVLSSTHPSTTSPDSDNQNTTNPWLETPLYTHICLARIPFMIHHNGDTGARERDWHRMSWLYDVARPLLFTSNLAESDARVPSAAASNFGGACTDKGDCVDWSQMCPKEMMDGAHIFGPGHE